MTTSTDLRFDALRAAIDSASARAPAISDWSVGRHVEHCALAASSIARALLASDSQPPGGPTAAGWIVLLAGRIPRGRGRAPQAVVPVTERAPAELHARLDEAAALTERARRADPAAWFRHFGLGVLRRDRALRFLDIHHRHHLRIVRDILRGAP